MSVRVVIVTGSGDAFSTVIVYVTVPPGSSTEAPSSVFVTSTVGGVVVNVTVAGSSAVASKPSSSWAIAVTVLS